MRHLIAVLGCLVFPFCLPVLAADSGELAREVEELRLRSVNLARDIWLFEQEADSEAGRLLVYLSVDPRLDERPAGIELRLGEDRIARHAYDVTEVDALAKGGAHRVYAEALDAGRHVLDAQLHTRSASGQDRHSTKLSFRSGAAVKTIELRLERSTSGVAELTVREWD